MPTELAPLTGARGEQMGEWTSEPMPGTHGRWVRLIVLRANEWSPAAAPGSPGRTGFPAPPPSVPPSFSGRQEFTAFSGSGSQVGQSLRSAVQAGTPLAAAGTR